VTILHRRWHTVIAGLLWPVVLHWGLILVSPDFPGAAQVRAQAPDVTADGGPVDTRPAAPRAEAQESFLTWLYNSSGAVKLVTVVIAAMSFYLFALVIWMALRYRASIAMPRLLLRELQELLEQKKYSEAYHRLLADDSLLARVLGPGVRKLPSGLAGAQRALELANEDATMEMEHRTTYLATVGTLGPMIGLVGTVYGMIIAFRVISTEGATPQASHLADGISTALVATLEGIAISIPAIYFYSMFRNRIARLSLEVAMAAEPLLERFAPGVRSQEPTSSSAQAPGVPVPVPMPMGGPASHPHPYAASAALAAASGLGGPRTALPPAETE
jgi:biopolymer transport protein ExbB